MKRLSDTQRARLIEGMQSAKWQLEQGYGLGICSRLYEAVKGGIITEKDFTYLTRWIMRMLDGSAMYSGWYIKKFGRQLTDKQARQARIRWCDWMIKELKK